MKLLLTGSSGFIGKHFLSLKEPKYNIISKSDLINLQINDFDGIDTVVHLAGLTNINNKTQLKSFLETNLEMTKTLASNAKKAKVNQFIFLSTIKVHASNISSSINEKTSCNPDTHYGLSKQLAEDCLREIETSDFRVAIIRSPVVYGPEVKGRILNLIKFSDTPFPLPFKNINSQFTAVFVGNLVQLINRIIEKNAHGIFLAGDPDSKNLEAFIYLIRYFLKRNPRFFNMPHFVLQFIKNFNKNLFQNLIKSSNVDNSMTNEMLDFNPPYSMSHGLNQTIDWYRGAT